MPETVGVLSSVTLLVVLVIAPTTAPTLSVIATVPKPAVAGAVVSTVMTTGVLGLLVLPAGSVAVVVMLCEPWPSGVVGVKVHRPSGWMVAVPITVPGLLPSVTVMVSPGVPVPENVGEVSSVEPPLLMGPVTLPTWSVALGVPGAAGAVVSTVRLRTGESALSVPVPSLAVTLSAWSPCPSAVGVKLQVPSGLTVVVPKTVVPSYTVMVCPGVAPVPCKVGVVSSELAPLESSPCTAPTLSVTLNAPGVAGTEGVVPPPPPPPTPAATTPKTPAATPAGPNPAAAATAGNAAGEIAATGAYRHIWAAEESADHKSSDPLASNTGACADFKADSMITTGQFASLVDKTNSACWVCLSSKKSRSSRVSPSSSVMLRCLPARSTLAGLTTCLVAALMIL